MRGLNKKPSLLHCALVCHIYRNGCSAFQYLDSFLKKRARARASPSPRPLSKGPHFLHSVSWYNSVVFNLENIRLQVEADAYDFSVAPTATNATDCYYESDVAAALFASRGNLSFAARLLNRRRNGLRSYLDRNPKMLQLWDDIRDEVVDRIEQNCYDLALEGDPTSIRFVLSTIGKDRGWNQRVETTGKDGGAIEFEELGTAKEQLVKLLAARNQPKLVVDNTGEGE